MKITISQSAGFKYEAEIDPLPAQPGKYTLAVESTWVQALGPEAARKVMQITTDTQGLGKLRDLIDSQLNDATRDKREEKDEQRVKFRNCDFKYRCTKTWDELDTVPSTTSARECSDCKKLVFMCTTDAEIALAMRENWCIAVPTESADNQPFMLGLPKQIDWVPPNNS